MPNYVQYSKVEPEPGAEAGPVHWLRLRPKGTGSATLLSILVKYARVGGRLVLVYTRAATGGSGSTTRLSDRPIMYLSPFTNRNSYAEKVYNCTAR